MVDKAIVLHDILIPSICKLYKEDFSNIRFGVSERNICARLAHHMENIMREYDAKNGTSFFTSYYADVEYNRMGNGDMKYYEDSLKRPKYMVSDLLIQSRGYKGNLLAVELKKKSATKEAIDNLLAELKNRLKISIFLWRKKLCISLIFSNFVVSNYKVIYFTLCTTCMQIS